MYQAHSTIFLYRLATGRGKRDSLTTKPCYLCCLWSPLPFSYCGMQLLTRAHLQELTGRPARSNLSPWLATEISSAFFIHALSVVIISYRWHPEQITFPSLLEWLLNSDLAAFVFLATRYPCRNLPEGLCQSPFCPRLSLSLCFQSETQSLHPSLQVSLSLSAFLF